MTISFILNGEDVMIRTDADRRLIDVLRNQFGLLGAKSGCFSGKCGICSVILNGEVVKSCLVPVFKIHGSEVVTLEGFSQTLEYNEIVDSFKEAGMEGCGHCDNGKIMAAEALLSKKNRPNKDEILRAFKGVRCRCIDPESIVKGIEHVIAKRQRRRYGSRNIVT